MTLRNIARVVAIVSCAAAALYLISEVVALGSGHIASMVRYQRASALVGALVSALLLLAADEALQRRALKGARVNALRQAARSFAPPLLAAVTFACGAILLASGATPADPGRVARLAQVMPLPLLEASHFTASLVGLLLLFLAQAISRRVDAALYLASAALAIGSVASLMKGADYEEAVLLAVALAALLTAHRTFTRRARLFDKPLSRGWLTAVALVVAASLWLGFFTYRHVAYSTDLWWRFAFSADAPRFLRASVAVTVVALVVGVRSLLRPVVPAAHIDRGADTDVAGAIARQRHTMANLVYLGDKATMWNEARTTFVMYGVQGRSWIALGDPVGAADTSRDLVRLFLETTHDIGVTPVFYQVSAERLADYADYGLALVKIGEEARVWLPSFTLTGAHQKGLRAVLNRMDREGARFRVAPPDEVTRLMPELREVSDEWLSAKRTGEKGFSLGFFHHDYISRFPVALIERGGRIEAFANLWLGAGGVELSPDLMRHRVSVPNGIMDGLLTQTMLWGRDHGYDWLNLGVAPLSGLPLSPVGHPWGRLGRFVYRYGEGYYNFRGLRAYKEKFHPLWQPRYLAYPGGLTLPRVLADVTALVAGGYRHIFVRSRRNVVEERSRQ